MLVVRSRVLSVEGGRPLTPGEEALYGNERAPSTDTQVCYYNAPGPIRPDRIAIYMQ